MPVLPVGNSGQTLNLPAGFDNNTLREFMTFGFLAKWLDRNQTGASSKAGHASLPSDRWIAFVEKEGKSGSVNMSANHYGKYFAYQWLTAWLLVETGTGIGAALRIAITRVGNQIPNVILPAVAGGIGKVPVAPAVSNIPAVSNPLGWLQGLTARSLWVRIAEGVIGGALLIVAASHLGGNTAVGKTATKIGKAAKIL